MTITDGRKAFSLIEVAIVAALAFMIIGLILNTFFTNIKNVKTGEKINNMEFQKFMIFKEFTSTINRFDYERIFEDDDIRIVSKSRLYVKKDSGDMKEISFSYFQDDEEHTIKYRVEGKQLVKEHDLEEKVVVDEIDNAGFIFDGKSIGFKGEIKAKAEGDGHDLIVPVEARFGIDPSICEIIYE